LVDASGPPSWLADARGRRLFVLGADGFIGSEVVRASLAAGAHVVAACVKKPWRLRPVAGHDGLELVEIQGARWSEVERWGSLRRSLAEADALALLAYAPPPAGAAPSERLRHEREVNARGARAVAEAARQAGAAVIFASSVDVYGPWHASAVDEETEPAPATPYAVAKLEAEEAVAELTSCLVLRIATVYGPREDGPRAIPSFVRAIRRGEAPAIHGDGSDVRDYVHVRDVAAAFVNAAIRVLDRRDRRLVVNVGSGIGRTTLEVLHSVAAIMDVATRPRHVPIRRPPSRLVIDPALARRLLRFHPRSDFDAALREEVAWLLAETHG